MVTHHVIVDTFLLGIANIVQEYTTADDTSAVVPVMDAVVFASWQVFMLKAVVITSRVLVSEVLIDDVSQSTMKLVGLHLESVPSSACLSVNTSKRLRKISILAATLRIDMYYLGS